MRIMGIIGLVLQVLASSLLAQESRPNIILIVADDLGYGELGCYGGHEIPTPHLDALAREGVRFTDGYVTAPFCAASRAGLFTGRYQTRFGFEFNPIGADNANPQTGLPTSENTLADALRDAGYATALIGKWHLGGTARFHPQRRGFDEYFGFLHEGHYYVPPPWEGVTTWLRRKTLPDGSQGRWTSPDGRILWSTHMGHREPDYDADNPIVRSSQPVAESVHLTDAFTREAVSFLERRRDQPFFLCVTFNAVHSPMQGVNRYLEQFAHIEDMHRRIFAAMLAHLDDSIGQVLKRLRDLELEKHTLVIFLSDNGGPTRELTSSNGALRGGKGQLYEGGVRVPFLMRWPEMLPKGHVERRPVSSLDVYTTAIAAAGVNLAPPNLPRDGVNLLPYLNDNQVQDPHAQLYWRVGDNAALRQDDWKIVRQGGSRTKPDWELYHLADDLSETRNVAAQHPAVLQRLTAAWEKMNADMAPAQRP